MQRLAVLHSWAVQVIMSDVDICQDPAPILVLDADRFRLRRRRRSALRRIQRWTPRL